MRGAYIRLGRMMPVPLGLPHNYSPVFFNTLLLRRCPSTRMRTTEQPRSDCLPWLSPSFVSRGGAEIDGGLRGLIEQCTIFIHTRTILHTLHGCVFMLHVGPACKRRVMVIRGVEKPTLVQVICAWWVRSFVYKLRGMVARTRRFGSSPAEASVAIVNTALGITVVDASGWDDLDRGGGAMTFLSRETAGGGRGVTHCAKASDDWLTRGERAWRSAMALGGRRAIMHKWMGTEIQEGRVGRRAEGARPDQETKEATNRARTATRPNSARK